MVCLGSGQGRQSCLGKGPAELCVPSWVLKSDSQRFTVNTVTQPVGPRRIHSMLCQLLTAAGEHPRINRPLPNLHVRSKAAFSFKG